jgi:hypothetical protein
MVREQFCALPESSAGRRKTSLTSVVGQPIVPLGKRVLLGKAPPPPPPAQITAGGDIPNNLTGEIPNNVAGEIPFGDTSQPSLINFLFALFSLI